MAQATGINLIDTSLRFALFGLECALSAEFSVREIERVFRDVAEDARSAKTYTFFEGDKLRVLGDVDEYEPETIRLRIEGSRIDQATMDRVLEQARYQALRLREAASNA